MSIAAIAAEATETTLPLGKASASPRANPFVTDATDAFPGPACNAAAPGRRWSPEARYARAASRT